MRISLNLAVPPKWRERYALAWSAPAALVGLIVLVVLIHFALADYREYQGLRAELADPTHREERLRQKEAQLKNDLTRPEFRGTLRAAQFVNQLIEQRQFSASGLTLEVVRLLPVGARLTGLEVSRSGVSSSVRFHVTGKDEEALESFVSNLEDSADFTDVAVTGEGFEQGQGSLPGEVNVSCTARYLGEGKVGDQEN